MARRPTIADLSREAGVSVATVDRVLNARHPVREETAHRVFEAANAIGYHAAGLIRQRIERDMPRYRFGFVLQKPDQYFFRSFADHLRQAVESARDFRRVAIIDRVAEQSPAGVPAKL